MLKYFICLFIYICFDLKLLSILYSVCVFPHVAVRSCY